MRPAAVSKPTVVLLLAAAIVVSGGLVSRWSAGGDEASAAAMSTDSADYRIAFWAARTEQQDLDYLSRTNLGLAYIDVARRSGDLALYDAAAVALEEALDLNPRYSLALAALSATYSARHDFTAALALAEHGYDQDPSSVAALGAMGDALLELGRYDEATDVLELFQRRLPGPAAEARLARLAFLFGRPEEAIERARTALELAGSSPDLSYRIALATYALDSGDIELAASAAEAALAQAPDSLGAIETMAQVRASQGDLEAAAELYERLLELGPDPGAHAALGDIYNQMGRPDAAEEHYIAVEPTARSITDDPAVFDREIALFLADHQRDVHRAVEIAERDLRNRQDIYAYDTLAWARYQANDLDGATDAMNQAMALGTHDPHIYYHAGMIAAATGDIERARQLLHKALTINPTFDVLQAPQATETLHQLGGP